MVRLRLAFLGTPAFAAAALDRLLGSPHEVVGVVTQPDRPRGRGQRSSFSPVKALAAGAGLPVLQPERLKAPEFHEAFRALNAELAVVAAYGRIIPDEVIATPRLGMINIHASILPEYRGAAPIHRAVIAGEVETGVSIMRVVRELDAGPVFAVARRPIGTDETSIDVEQALARAGADLCVEVIDAIAAGTAVETPQDHARATYAPRLTREEGWLDWALPAIDLHNRVRGLQPWPLAQGVLAGQRLLFLRSAVARPPYRARPGEVLAAGGDDFLVAAGDGALRLVDVQPEGRRVMTAREFLAGRPVVPGARFEPPLRTLP
ncbi:MAG: methionyl-tRNA formyltransferase [Acidobacteria bacterium]|nr:methionyl-tRNA formyltransferase [Acidobacteriota bacterium]